MKFRPLHNRIVIKRIEAEAKSAGGIVIPGTAKESPKKRKLSLLVRVDVMRALSSFRSMPKPATGVVRQWSGTDVKIDDEHYLMMKESDVMGVLVETEARKRAA